MTSQRRVVDEAPQRNGQRSRLGGTCERHHARTLHGLRARIAAKLLALAAGVWLNHYLGRPTRAFAALAKAQPPNPSGQS